MISERGRHCQSLDTDMLANNETTVIDDICESRAIRMLVDIRTEFSVITAYPRILVESIAAFLEKQSMMKGPSGPHLVRATREAGRWRRHCQPTIDRTGQG